MDSHRSLSQESTASFSRQHFSIWMQGMCTPWQQVLHMGRRVELTRDQTLFGKGKMADGLFFNQKGVLRLNSVDEEGRQAILLYVTENNILGDAAMLNGMPVFAFFTAVEDCTLYFFDKNTVFEKILPNHPELNRNLLEYLAFKIGVLLHHHCEILNTDVRGKVCRLLFDICRYSGLKQSFTPKISLQEMATALGLHRATFSKIINELKKESIIATPARKEIEILDIKALARYAGCTFAL